MTKKASLQLTDGDGHIIEDVPAILSRLPKVYAEPMLRLREQFPDYFRAFPSLSHMHAMPLKAPERKGTYNPGPQGWVQFLDEVGIQRTVLYPTLALAIGLQRDHHYAVASARAYNDWIAETYLQDGSGRFSAVAALPVQVPEEAAAELRRATTQLGFCAGVVPSHGLVNHLGSPMYHPLFAEAERLNVGLAFHGGSHSGFGFDDINVFAAAHALGHPFSLLITLAAMVSNGVYERFPFLRTAYLEGGSAWILMATERMSESFSAIKPLVAGDTLDLKGRSVGKYIRELIANGRIVIGCEGGEEHLETAIESLGSCPFMYSSDYPHEVDVTSCLHELEELSELKISSDDYKKMIGGNARQFYRLD